MTKILDIKTILIYSIIWNLDKFAISPWIMKIQKWSTTVWKSQDQAFSILDAWAGILHLLCSWKNSAWIEDDIKIITEFPCLLGHRTPCIYMKNNRILFSLLKINALWDGTELSATLHWKFQFSVCSHCPTPLVYIPWAQNIAS